MGDGAGDGGQADQLLHLERRERLGVGHGDVHEVVGHAEQPPDGDPIDALLLLAEPTFPGCMVRARVIAVFWVDDTRGPDAKLLCVPATDPRQLHLQELEDVPMHQIAEIWHFFEIYEALAPDKSAETRGWERRGKAVEALEDARRRFADQLPAATGTEG